MLGTFLQPDAKDIIARAWASDEAKHHALEVVELGYTIVRGAIPKAQCDEVIAGFRSLEAANAEIFAEHRDEHGHYPRIVSLHYALPSLTKLFTENKTWLAAQDLLFGKRTALYTSLFYETGSQQAIHRDTPVFCTRPEYLYFGTTVYLERADDENGCLEVLEGAHKLPELDREAIALEHCGSLDAIDPLDNKLWTTYQNRVVEQAKAAGITPKRLYMAPGDSLIWHPQLPHGGTPIKDRSRTRFSFVMHTTPEDVPVYHQHAFFNPQRQFSTRAPWKYRNVDGRKFAMMGDVISFGHVKDYDIASLRAA